MRRRVFLGVDIGTSSSKGVLVDSGGGIVRTAVREHTVHRPGAGRVEMDGELWWAEFVELASELTAPADVEVAAVGVSGMGPCVLLTGDDGTPLRPAILYGVDTRAEAQIERLNGELGAEAIFAQSGSMLSSQAVGPKLAWVREHEPEVYAAARRVFVPSSWLAYRLTGEYVLDYHSASQCTPLFDTVEAAWFRPWCDHIAPGLELPPLRWPGECAGVTMREIGGIPAGVPVITGTIDAWSEAVSVDAQNPGDLMLMYGSTMFLIHTTSERITTPSMWGTVGAFEGTRNLAGGMAASGSITAWVRELTGGADYPTLLAEAEASGPGAGGLLVLPYFEGERTPIFDPRARGVVAGLTLRHTRGDLYRAVLEATAFGVRHNVDALTEAGSGIERVVAVGGGAQSALWTQIVSDVTGLTQVVPTVTIGASYGAAFLAAGLVERPSIAEWNPPSWLCTPDPASTARYDELYRQYRALYPASRDIVHTLATHQESLTGDEAP